MERRKLGGLEVSAVGLGCATMTPFYGEPDPEAGIATIRRARELGVDFLDTADGYARGRNEELIAQAVAGHRDDYAIASKFGNLGLLGDPRFADGRPEYVREACDKSLRRLNTETIDLYYIHRVDPSVPIEDTVGAMGKLVQQGKVKYLGLSEAKPDTIRRAHKVHPISAVQTEYSLLYRTEAEETRKFTIELGIGFVAYAPLGRGFLAGVIKEFADVDGRRAVHPRFQRENFARNRALVAKLEGLAAKKGCTPSQITLAWLL